MVHIVGDSQAIALGRSQLEIPHPMQGYQNYTL